MEKLTVEIKEFVLRIGKKELKLNVNEVKELQELLNKTFGNEKIAYVPTYPYYPAYPYYWKWNDNTWGVTYGESNAASGSISVTTDTVSIYSVS